MPIKDVVAKLDTVYLREALDSETFRNEFYRNCKDFEFAEMIRQKMA